MDSNEASRIYAVLENFDRSEWRTFARVTLGLRSAQMEECEENYRGDLREQKYQMVRKWMNTNGRSATVDKLEQLVENRNVQTTSQQQRPTRESNSSRERQQQHLVATPTNDLPNPPLFVDNSGNNSAKGQKRAQNRTKETSGQSQAESKAFAGANASATQKMSNFNTVKPEETLHSNSATDISFSQDGSIDQDGKKKKGFSGTVKNFFRKASKKKSAKKQKSERDVASNSAQGFCDLVNEVKVLPTSQAIFNEKSADEDLVYEIQKPKGCVLILNNSFSDDEKNVRHGSDKDVAHMNELWQQMGCEIHGQKPQCEKTAQEMECLLREMTQLRKKYSFLVVIIMTHGVKKNGDLVVMGSDNKTVKVKDIERMFSNARAENLRNVPKFFIFQFCRGEIIDKGVVLDTFDDECMEKEMNLFASSTTELVETDGGTLLPTISDILIAYATHDDYAAPRDVNNGSWFINAITNVFMNYAKEEDVAHMLTRVHGAMKRKTGWYRETDSNDKVTEIKAMSNHKSSLTKCLYLFPSYPK